jgi:lipid A 3-O-deacylase
MRTLLVPAVLLILISSIETPADQTGSDTVTDHYGAGAVLGTTYKSADDFSFAQVFGFALIDYEKIWRHAAPAPLRFKIEYSLGTTFEPDWRTITSANIFALYYLDKISSETVRPYIEGGIGIIYTDFQLKEQGSRINFNPVAGVGLEFSRDSKHILFAAIRLHHISNAHIHEDNRGINSIVLMIGRSF